MPDLRRLLTFVLTGVLCLSSEAALYVNKNKVVSADVSVSVDDTATVTLLNSSTSSACSPYCEPSSSAYFEISLPANIPKAWYWPSSAKMTIRGVKATSTAQSVTIWQNSKKDGTPVTLSITVTGGGGDAPENVGSFSVTPYVQHPATNAMTVLFFTTSDCAATVRCWPANPADGVVTQSLEATSVKASDLVSTGHASDKPVWGTQYRHRVRFEGLKSGTKYAYGVRLEGTDGSFAYTNVFRTVPDRDTPVRFVAYSDAETIPPSFVDTTSNNKADAQGRVTDWEVAGKGESNTYPVSRSVGYASNIVHMAAWEPDLIVIAGDLVARGGVQLFWDEFWKENAGANGVGYNDPAGSTPILATLGNHDLYDNKGVAPLSYKTDQNGELAIKKYLTYFEFNPNGVDYAKAAQKENDTRDLSQLFHREDYGPVTLVFIDSNNSELDGNDTNTGLTRNGSTGARSPSVLPGSLQYTWLTNCLADAQMKSRFTFVVCHHCPYSSGKHIAARDNQCALPIRALSDAMIRYGVDGWLCGHDEMQEHSQISGTEVRPDGSTRPHTVNVYDLGSAGDGLKGVERNANANAVFRAYRDSTDGVHYGHLQVEVGPNAEGVWQCTMTPMYSYVKDSSGASELRAYKDRVVIREDSQVAYEQRKGVTLVEGDGSVLVEDGGEVVVSEEVRRIEGAVLTKGKVKVVFTDEKSGKSYDITGAFVRAETTGTSGTGVSIRLDPEGGVDLGESEPIPVKPVLTKAGDGVEPLAVGETVSVGVRTIPGLTYRLRRSECVGGVSQGEVVDTKKARDTRTDLSDPMKDGKPNQAFYAVEATE